MNTQDTEPIKLIYAELDGKRVCYSSRSNFEVQIGKNKSAYHTRYISTGNLGLALAFYRSLNIGNGYKKRLVCWTMTKPVLARYIS